MIKGLYHLLALVAIVHLLVLVGLAGYLLASGRLDRQRMDAVVDVLRGGRLPSTPVVARPASPQTQPAPELSQTTIARNLEQDEIARRLFEQRRREIDDRLRLTQAIRLEVIRRQEELARRSEEFRRQMVEQFQQSGFQKELELLESVSGKKAKEVLIGKKESEAVRLLTAMDVRTGKKIIEACKSPEEMAWVSRILDRVHNLRDDQNGEPPGSKESGLQ